MKNPLISCLCISHNSPSQLNRAINCFKNQTYNNKELIIIFESNDLFIKKALDQINEDNIKSFEIPSFPKLSLGELRNISVEKSNGEYFCQWDDDDWYANDRLEVQFNLLSQSNLSASMLLYWIMFDSKKEAAYLSPSRLWEGSILCKKNKITSECNYAKLEKGEDTILVGKLIEDTCIYPIIKPNLYIYVFHGKNTWNYAHFNKFFERGLRLPEYSGKLIKDILEEKVDNKTATELLNSPSFLKDIKYRFDLVDRYRLQLI